MDSTSSPPLSPQEEDTTTQFLHSDSQMVGYNTLLPSGQTGVSTSFVVYPSDVQTLGLFRMKIKLDFPIGQLQRPTTPYPFILYVGYSTMSTLTTSHDTSVLSSLIRHTGSIFNIAYIKKIAVGFEEGETHHIVGILIHWWYSHVDWCL